MLLQNLSVLDWGCRLMKVDLYNDRKTVVVLLLSWSALGSKCHDLACLEQYHNTQVMQQFLLHLITEKHSHHCQNMQTTIATADITTSKAPRMPPNDWTRLTVFTARCRRISNANAGMCYGQVSVRPSVRLTQAAVPSKRLNLSSCNQSHAIVSESSFLQRKIAMKFQWDHHGQRGRQTHVG